MQETSGVPDPLTPAPAADPLAESESTPTVAATEQPSPASNATAAPGVTSANGSGKAQSLEEQVRETGYKIEAAAQDLGQQLDAKIESNEAAREVKAKVGGLWNRIKETIK